MTLTLTSQPSKGIRAEIAKIEKGEWGKINNPIKNAPHTQEICISTKWNRPYDRETAAYPIVSSHIL